MIPPMPPSDLRARVLAAVAAEPVPTRPAGLRRQALLVGAGFVASAAILFAIGGPGPYGRPSSYFVSLALLWLGVTAAAIWGGVARGWSMLGRPSSARLLVAALTPLALLLTAVVAGAAFPGFEKPAGVREHLVCVMFTLLFALGPLIAFSLVRRRSDPVTPRLTGASIGAAAGAWGALCIELRCEHAQLGHVLLAHVVPVMLLALVGSLVGDRVIAVRARPD